MIRNGSRLGKAAARFGQTDGAVALIFAILLIPLMLLLGLSTDYIRYAASKARLDAAVDAAALASANMTNATINAQAAPTQQTTRSTMGLAMLDANLADGTDASVVNRAVDVTISGLNVTVAARYTAQLDLVFGAIFGMPSWTFSGVATAQASLPPYIDVYLLIDTSGSMALGASTADINALISGTGCAFACHDNAGDFTAGGVPTDRYGWAVANNITLRFQVINRGIGALIDHLTSDPLTAARVRVALYGVDNTLNTLVPLTGSLSSIKSNYPSTPSSSSETAGATHINENIGSFLTAVGSGGDGSSQASAKKLVILATDGVQDPNRTWTWNLPLRAQVAPIDISFCTTAASRNITVGVIHTPYLPMTWDWGYVATLGQPSQIGGSGTRADDVAPQLSKCAGQYYVAAADPDTIANAFVALFKKFISPRLTS